MAANKMTEKEKMYFFCLLIPILWPLGLSMAICDIAEASWRGVRRLYRAISESST